MDRSFRCDDGLIMYRWPPIACLAEKKQMVFEYLIENHDFEFNRVLMQ